jgi:N-acetylmuramoyl-L-alanine amidase
MAKQRKIYINAGHGRNVNGGYDPGAIGPTGLKEHDVALDLSHRVAHLLRAKGNQYQTNGERVESLVDAYKAANLWKADALISLHMNAAANPSARGMEVLYCSPQSKPLADRALLRIFQYINSGDKGPWLESPLSLVSRGVKQRTNLGILKNAKMPAILVEGAFISNSTEEGWLRNPRFLQEMAQAIADAVDEWAQANL